MPDLQAVCSNCLFYLHQFRQIYRISSLNMPNAINMTHLCRRLSITEQSSLCSLKDYVSSLGCTRSALRLQKRCPLRSFAIDWCRDTKCFGRKFIFSFCYQKGCKSVLKDWHFVLMSCNVMQTRSCIMLGWCEERQPKDSTSTGLAMNVHCLTHILYLS